MAPRSKVVGLPKEVKQWLDAALIDGNFADYELLAGELKGKGYDISKSSLHRYGSQFEAKLAAVKLATEQAEAIAKAVPDDENSLGDALLRVIQEKTFTMLMNMEEDPKIGFAKLASIAIESGFSSTNVKEFRSKVKTRAKEAAAEVSGIAKKAGLTDEAIEVIKKAHLGDRGMIDAVLLPYQQAWVADDSQVLIAEKSRRVGLSWAEAAKSVLKAAPTNGVDTWYIGYNKDMSEEFILDCAFWAKHYGLVADEMEELVLKDEDKDILAFRIRFASGFRITALSSRPSNLRGKQGRVVIDEAAFHDNLGELLKAAFALLIWGGSVSVISTHNGVDNAFNEVIQDTRAGKKPYVIHRITFDEAIAQGLCKRVFLATGRTWSPEAEQEWTEAIRSIYRPNDSEELDVIPAQSGGAYLSRSLIESRMDASAPVLRMTCPENFEQLPDRERELFVTDWIEENLAPLVDALPKNIRSCYGLDFGRNGDLSVLVPLIEGQRLHRRCPFLIEMRNVPFRQQEQLTFWLADRLPGFSGSAHDARGNGQYLAEVAMQRYGSSMVHQVMLTLQWYRDNMPKMKAAFEDGEISIPKDADVLADLRCIVVDKGVPKIPDTGRTKGKDGGQRHGDAAIAIVLAWFASLNPGAIIEFESVGDSRIGSGYEDFMGAL